MQFVITADVGDFAKRFEEFSNRRLRAGLATGVTRTAVEVRKRMQVELAQVFDRPTPYTRNQLKYVPAKAGNLAGGVGFNIFGVSEAPGSPMRFKFDPVDDVHSPPASRYLRAQIEGGARRQKRAEIALERVLVMPRGWVAVPGERAKIDAYGNQSVGEIKQILSFFNAASNLSGSFQNMTAETRAKRLKGTRKRAGFDYFVVRPGEKRTFARASGKTGTHKLPPGVYRRTYYALGTRVEPVLIFVQTTNYKRRYDFNGTAAKHVSEILPGKIKEAMEQSLQYLNQQRASAAARDASAP